MIVYVADSVKVLIWILLEYENFKFYAKIWSISIQFNVINIYWDSSRSPSLMYYSKFWGYNMVPAHKTRPVGK